MTTNSLYACLAYVFGADRVACYNLEKQDDFWFYRLQEWARPRGMVPALLPWASNGMFDPTYLRGLIVTDGQDNWMVLKGISTDPAAPVPPANFAVTPEGFWNIQYMLVFLPMHPRELLRPV